MFKSFDKTDPVSKVLPQPQVTVIWLYSGWISGFIVLTYPFGLHHKRTAYDTTCLNLPQ